MTVSARIDDDAAEVLRNAVDVLGAKWSVPVLARLSGGTQRFGELLRRIDGVSRRMLAATLRQLEQDGLIERRVHARVPSRVEYELTDAGHELLFALRPLLGWGREHLNTPPMARGGAETWQTQSRIC